MNKERSEFTMGHQILSYRNWNANVNKITNRWRSDT